MVVNAGSDSYSDLTIDSFERECPLFMTDVPSDPALIEKNPGPLETDFWTGGVEEKRRSPSLTLTLPIPRVRPPPPLELKVFMPRRFAPEIFRSSSSDVVIFVK